MASTENDNDNLPLGNNRPSFSAFGNASLSTSLRACEELNLDAFQTIAVEDVWKRSANRLGYLFLTGSSQ